MLARNIYEDVGVGCVINFSINLLWLWKASYWADSSCDIGSIGFAIIETLQMALSSRG
jgi:hypothetical protein